MNKAFSWYSWLVFSSVFVLTSCGAEIRLSPGPNQGSTPPNTRATEQPSVVEDRENRCFVKSSIEDNQQDREQFLNQLSGTWKYIPPSDSIGTPRWFHFHPGRRYAAVIIGSEHAWHGKEEITFRKVCVSKPLGAELGDFAGYRILELMAENNEGGVAFAIKLGPPSGNHSYPTLRLTERVYERWAARDPLIEESEVLKDGRVFVYPNREE
jgi:hypothetical protein